ncbi:MAG: hypothetical protein ACP5L0_07585 [Caldisphaera sp.]|uniref:hypothetical protein n=1 Tax=Caldisphaera sp. TaxID=2060322 RepID=UPI003D136CED
MEKEKLIKNVKEGGNSTDSLEEYDELDEDESELDEDDYLYDKYGLDQWYIEKFLEYNKPKTKFLKNKISEAHFSKKDELEYIIELFKVEDYALSVVDKKHSPSLNTFYRLAHNPAYGIYSKEYYEMLKELSHNNFRLLAHEFLNRIYDLELKDLSKEDRKKILYFKKEFRNEENRRKQKLIEKRRKIEEGLHNWWIKNGGKE